MYFNGFNYASGTAVSDGSFDLVNRAIGEGDIAPPSVVWFVWKLRV